MILFSSRRNNGRPCGSIAQLGEHLPYKQRVIGSSPIVPTIFGPVVQLVRTPACHAGGRRFEPDPGRQNASVAQSVEQGTENPRVIGSIPIGSTNKTCCMCSGSFSFFCHGGSEWARSGADRRSVRSAGKGHVETLPIDKLLKK